MKNKSLIDLNEIAFERLKQCKKTPTGIITFPKARIRLSTLFSLKKQLVNQLLIRFKQEGKIEFVKFRGVKLKC